MNELFEKAFDCVVPIALSGFTGETLAAPQFTLSDLDEISRSI